VKFYFDSHKKNKILPTAYFQHEDVVGMAKDLIGKVLVTDFEGKKTSGIIVETEAYTGINDKAAHSYGGKRTARTEVMYQPGGVAYVYLCYGIHHLFNIVTNKKDIPQAILIRALQPLEGIDIMLQRRKKIKADYTLTRGPGSLAGALGLNRSHTGLLLGQKLIQVEDRGIVIPDSDIRCGARIGVAYAGADALLPYRFWADGNPYVSK